MIFFQVILVLGDEKDPNKGIKGVIDIDDDDDDDFGSMMFKGSSSSAGKQIFFLDPAQFSKCGSPSIYY